MDTFTYRATDGGVGADECAGNMSQPATVTILVERPGTRWELVLNGSSGLDESNESADSETEASNVANNALGNFLFRLDWQVADANNPTFKTKPNHQQEASATNGRSLSSEADNVTQRILQRFQIEDQTMAVAEPGVKDRLDLHLVFDAGLMQKPIARRLEPQQAGQAESDDAENADPAGGDPPQEISQPVPTLVYERALTFRSELDLN